MRHDMSETHERLRRGKHTEPTLKRMGGGMDLDVPSWGRGK